ncbi:hypothetical protein FN846DRAFT_906801 [Sphaerosporella brunnea]|uniref:Uncharacterized protein n=1 Tax=Sphaerosporella brunnea TaxID=1250544 RepID=A0A5J5EXH4_9PEZI|nr:hypothetical protein FN846DRAFT_906801 [Sphaerosporella brunnea]
MSLPDLTAGLSDSQIRRALRGRWKSVYLRALKITIEPANPRPEYPPLRDSSSLYAPNELYERLLRSVIADPAFPLAALEFSPDDARHRLSLRCLNVVQMGAKLWPFVYLHRLIDYICCLVHSFPRFGVQIISQTDRAIDDVIGVPLGVKHPFVSISPDGLLRFQHTARHQEFALPLMSVLELREQGHRRPQARRYGDGFIVANLLALAQTQVRLLSGLTKAIPTVIAIRSRLRPSSSEEPPAPIQEYPVYVVYTTEISRRYARHLSALQEPPEDVTVRRSRDYDPSVIADMQELASELTALCPRLVAAIVDALGGEDRARARWMDIERERMQQRAADEAYWDAAFREQERRRRQRRQRRARQAEEEERVAD